MMKHLLLLRPLLLHNLAWVKVAGCSSTVYDITKNGLPTTVGPRSIAWSSCSVGHVRRTYDNMLDVFYQMIKHNYTSNR